MTFTSAAGSGLRMQSGWRSRLRRHGRWISGRRSATCARCRHPRPRVTGRSLSCRSTPARGSPRPVALDLDDLRLSARRAIVRIYGKGERVREVPIHPKLREALENWLEDRKRWPGSDNRALFVNRRGGRLTSRGAHDVITGIAAAAGLEDHVTAHVLRHSFATTLVRGHTDLVVAAELLGHARLETVGYGEFGRRTR